MNQPSTSARMAGTASGALSFLAHRWVTAGAPGAKAEPEMPAP